MKFEIACPWCRGVYFDAVDGFDPSDRSQSHGANIVMKQKYVDQGWVCFANVNNGPGELVCPDCEGPLVNSVTGLLTVIPNKSAEDERPRRGRPPKQPTS